QTPVRLLQPLAVRQSAAGLVVDGLDLALADGRISGGIDTVGDRLAGSLTAAGVPLGVLAALAGGPQLEGTLDAALRLSGRAQDPAVDLDLTLRAEAPQTPGIEDMPPLLI